MASSRLLALALATASVCATTPAMAATLLVGPGRPYSVPSDAARAAVPGDTVRIAPGSYRDCAVWTANRLTVEGDGPGVVLMDKICQGKAIFVIHADDVTVRGLTFAHARIPEGNGAGIRAEGANLTVEDSKFVDDQDGILSAPNPSSTILVRNSEFDHDGACDNACAHGIYAGRIALLKVEHSHFFATQVGHHIKSRAARTEITDCKIEDGPAGTSSYLVDLPNGGSLILRDNVLEKGPKSENHSVAIIIGEEGTRVVPDELVIEHNSFTNDGPPTTFVKNLTPTPARLIGNTLMGNSTAPLKTGVSRR